jgi:hypothetical protein
MSKGSGRRRISPADGLRYDAELDITNIEQRGARAKESMDFRKFYCDPGAPPTRDYWYGVHGRRWGGRGRKDDYRCWKNFTRGKQYEKAPA